MATYRRWLTERFLADVWGAADAHHGSITSGCRTQERNRSVGGHPQSRHTFESGWGLACDLVFESPDGRDAARLDLEAKGWHTYVGPEYGKLRLHVQAFRAGDPLPTVTT